jgi:hypothetical protein
MIKKEYLLGCKTDKTNDKTPYCSPQFVTHGDIRELTRTSTGKNKDTTQEKDKNKTG